MSSEATTAIKTTCPFCTGRLNDHPAPVETKGFLAWANRFVSCPACNSVFRMVPSWLRLMFSSVLLGFSIMFALLLVGAGYLILWWLNHGGELSSFSILLFAMISAFLIYGGMRSSEQLFYYALGNMMILVSHPDLERNDV